MRFIIISTKSFRSTIQSSSITHFELLRTLLFESIAVSVFVIILVEFDKYTIRSKSNKYELNLFIRTILIFSVPPTRIKFHNPICRKAFRNQLCNVLGMRSAPNPSHEQWQQIGSICRENPISETEQIQTGTKWALHTLAQPVRKSPQLHSSAELIEKIWNYSTAVVLFKPIVSELQMVEIVRFQEAARSLLIWCDPSSVFVLLFVSVFVLLFVSVFVSVFVSSFVLPDHCLQGFGVTPP